MKLALLKGISTYFSQFKKIYWCRRVDDNLLALNLEGNVFYIDLTRSKSAIFYIEDSILGQKSYQAPFDVKLRLCHNAKLLSCEIDGDNRILRLYFLPENAYKKQEFCLELEFTGKYTNAILLDANRVVIQALRHISESKRIVKVGKVLEPLPQPLTPIPCDEMFVDKEILKQLHKKRLDSELNALKAQQLRLLESKEANFLHILHTLPPSHTLTEDSKRYSLYAQTILAHLHELTRQEVTKDSILLPHTNDTSNMVQIPIPKDTLSFSQLAQHYFTLSKKYAQKAQNIYIQIENLKECIDFLQAQKELITKAKTLEDIKILSHIKQHKKQKKHQNFEIFFINGMKIGVGKNANQNLELLKCAHSDDMWLHIRDIASSHMIIFCGKTKLKQEVLEKAGEILVGLCKVKMGDFIVDYTRRKFVKIVQGANVVYAKHQSLEYRK